MKNSASDTVTEFLNAVSLLQLTGAVSVYFFMGRPAKIEITAQRTLVPDSELLPACAVNAKDITPGK